MRHDHGVHTHSKYINGHARGTLDIRDKKETFGHGNA
jgi:hypothetical protein